MGLTLILGGARSGKTELGLRLGAASSRPVVYVATAEPSDEEMARRIENHRNERPSSWRTIEEPRDVVAALRGAGIGGEWYLILDCLSLWVSNLMGAGQDEDAILRATDDLLAWHAERGGDGCIVSSEVGLGLVPDTAIGRAYRDALGRANQAIARAATRTYLVVAGLALDLTSASAQPIHAFGPLPRGEAPAP